MASTTSSLGDKLCLNFYWQGPNQWNGGCSHNGLDVKVVDLLFKGAKSEFSVNLPENINPNTPRKFSFTCRRYQEGEIDPFGQRKKILSKETRPASLSVTIEQVRNLTLKAGYFEKGRAIGPIVMDYHTGRVSQQQTVRRNDRKVALELPDELEGGQTYNLIVSSRDLSLTASLVKSAPQTAKDETKQEEKESLPQERLQVFGKMLAGAMQAIDASSNREGSDTSPADILGKVIQGVVRTGQQTINEDFIVPESVAGENSLDLDGLQAEELQKRLEEVFIRDKKYECEKARASHSGDIDKLNTIIQADLTNSQYLVTICEALKRKGITPLRPVSEEYKAAERESAELMAQAMKRLLES